MTAKQNMKTERKRKQHTVAQTTVTIANASRASVITTTTHGNYSNNSSECDSDNDNKNILPQTHHGWVGSTTLYFELDLTNLVFSSSAQSWCVDLYVVE